MRKKSDGKGPPNLVLPHMTTSGLRGKQSVRASFKLSETCIHAINIISKQLGIKQKSLFDHLAEDLAALEGIAQTSAGLNPVANHRVQKSYIISRKTLLSLRDVSKKYNISQDVLIERSVQRLLPIIQKEKENHEKRKGLVSLVATYVRNGDKILEKIKKTVGVQDPMYKAFSTITATCGAVKNQVDTLMERGSRMEDFETGSQDRGEESRTE